MNAYDCWCTGTVREISSYTFPVRRLYRFPAHTLTASQDGKQSDRFVVDFMDVGQKRTGVFFKRWYEICGVDDEKFMPRITKAIVVDMLRTVRLPSSPATRRI